MKPWGWTKQQVQTLQARYAEANNKQLADELGISVKALGSKASALGLTKSRAGLLQCRAQPGSRQGQVRQLLIAAGPRGLRAIDIAERLGISTDAAHTTLSNMTLQGLIWIVRGRRGQSRWFAEKALADQARDAASGLVALAPTPAPVATAPAPAPMVVTPATRRVVAPPMPDRYATAVPTEGGFASRRPGDYAIPPSRWVTAVTGQL